MRTIKAFFINLLLALVALVAIVLLAPTGWVLGVIFSLDKSQYNLNIAISLDQLGNVILGPLMNILLRKKDGHLFGNPDETISFVLGENKASGHLRKLGKSIADGLNKVDPDHVEKAKS